MMFESIVVGIIVAIAVLLPARRLHGDVTAETESDGCECGPQCRNPGCCATVAKAKLETGDTD